MKTNSSARFAAVAGKLAPRLNKITPDQLKIYLAAAQTILDNEAIFRHLPMGIAPAAEAVDQLMKSLETQINMIGWHTADTRVSDEYLKANILFERFAERVFCAAERLTAQKLENLSVDLDKLYKKYGIN